MHKYMTKNPQNEVRKKILNKERKEEERAKEEEKKRSLGHGYLLCQSFYFGKI